MSDTVVLALILIPCLIVAIVFHEVAHGWVANLLGDPTAKEMRRLSLNPLRHVDPIGTVILPGVLALSGAPVFGWAKPVPVVQRRLNNPRYGMMAVAAAGPGTNIVLATIGAILFGLFLGTLTAPPQGTTEIVFAAFNYFIVINLFLALFNLLPIPPFDGSHIVEGLLPPDLARSYAKLRPFGFPLLFLVLLVIPWLFPGLGIVENVVVPPVEWAREKFMMLAVFVAGG
ncbi:site-2 protease family protein [Novosphingobium sp. PC22D]|uniref:site-2 protease family protein n=1 Tax=Novosphingobium sp. PC22D TaxID=1962403 RepID=UPI000BF0C5FB|nr:site-2 protease family protein [Novosphingobium sp. PC22D]PEQ14398.1 site-2 protease family protein [Novosphingobium sp. PC22D]